MATPRSTHFCCCDASRRIIRVEHSQQGGGGVERNPLLARKKLLSDTATNLREKKHTSIHQVPDTTVQAQSCRRSGCNDLLEREYHKSLVQQYLVL